MVLSFTECPLRTSEPTVNGHYCCCHPFSLLCYERPSVVGVQWYERLPVNSVSMSAPFGDYDHNIIREIELQQPIQWLGTKATAIPWGELSTMLYQRVKTRTCGKSS